MAATERERKTLLYIGNFLVKHGFTPNPNVALASRLSGNYQVLAVSDRRNQLARLLHMAGAVLLYRDRIDAAIIDTFSTRAFWFAYTTARLCDLLAIPYITILHGGNLPARLKQSLRACEKLFGRARANISPSRYLQEAFTSAGYQSEYIPNFVAIEQIEYLHRKQARPRLLWVRSFSQTYNPTLAIEILSQLAQRYSDVRLCMVGPDNDGSLAETIKLSERLSVRDRVEFTGRLSKPEWLKLAADYDIFINTTNFDNHPVSVIEAMALGMPVVCTNVGGLPYLIDDGENGLLVPPNRSQEFVDKIDLLLNQPKLVARLSINARRAALQFDWPEVIAKWVSVIEHVIQ